MPKKRAGKKEQQKRAAKLVECRDAGDWGKGVFAKQTILKGTRIFKESPLILEYGAVHDRLDAAWKTFQALPASAQKQIFEFAAVEDDATRCMKRDLEDLLKEIQDARNAFVADAALVEGTSHQEYLEDHAELTRMKEKFCGLAKAARLTAILRTSGFETEYADEYSDSDEQAVGLFPATARLNHSCCPNVVVTFNSNLQTVACHALRDIAPGEQLLRSYLGDMNTYATTAAKRSQLLHRWGFRCECEACKGEGVDYHDSIRLLIRGNYFLIQEDVDIIRGFKFLPVLSGWNKSQCLERALARVNELLHLFAHEGVLPYAFATQLMTVAQAAFEIDCGDAANPLVDQALTVVAELAGEDNPFYEKWGSLMSQWVNEFTAVEERKNYEEECEKEIQAGHPSTPKKSKAGSSERG